MLSEQRRPMSRVRGSRHLPSPLDTQTIRGSEGVSVLARHPSLPSNDQEIEIQKQRKPNASYDKEFEIQKQRKPRSSQDPPPSPRHDLYCDMMSLPKPKPRPRQTSRGYKKQPTPPVRATSPHPWSISPPANPVAPLPQVDSALPAVPSPPKHRNAVPPVPMHKSSSQSQAAPSPVVQEPTGLPVPPRHRSPAPSLSRPSSRPVCVVCDQDLQTNQQVVRTDYGHIHIQCFVCDECGEPLEHSEFYFRDDRALCHLDYHQIYSEKCGYCSTPVESDGIMALDKHWHKGHFFCHDCSNPFGETEDYFVDGEDVLCEPCFNQKHAVKCWRCRILLYENAIDALGRTWCSQCFSCEDCTVPFKTKEFILREDGTLVCHDCETRRIKHECWN